MNAWNDPDVQGLLFEGYGETMLEASYHVLRFGEPARAKDWLAALLPKVTVGAGGSTRPFCLNVAFTRSGLESLGIAPASIEESFEPAFQDGMVSERRRRLLGDAGKSDPDNWTWGGPKQPVDAILMLYARDAASLKVLEDGEFAALTAHGLTRVAPPIAATSVDPKLPFQLEPFGFADGISQPKPVVIGSEEDFQALAKEDGGKADTEKKHADAVPVGEFVFGYKNAYWRDPIVPGWKRAEKTGRVPFGLKGSYLVVRQLEQDVAGFWNALMALEKNDPARAEWLAAKMVGRWRSGAPVKPGETVDPLKTPGDRDNGFDFSKDSLGLGVPVGSHIRRSNPRGMELAETPAKSLEVARRHRILRRTRTYGPPAADRLAPDGAKRGIVFVALNANIERQFEFVSHSWLNNPVFGSLYQETDPLAGDAGRTVHGGPARATATTFSVPADPIRERFHGIASFVTVVGGAYFFLPSLSAMRDYLAAS